jgi:hypothetical protein
VVRDGSSWGAESGELRLQKLVICNNYLVTLTKNGPILHTTAGWYGPL